MNLKVNNILLVRTDRIGDVVLSLPLAALIKKYFPGCKLTFLLREYTKPLAENNPFIDEIIVLPENEGGIDRKKIIKELRSREFDTGIIVYPTFQIAWILFRSGIKNRIATGFRWYSFLFNSKIYEHRRSGEKHELEYNVNLLKKIGIDEIVNHDNVSFNIQVNDRSKQKIDDFFEDAGLDESLPIVIIHPGSGGSAIDLPINKYKELIDSLAHGLNINILLTGSEDEKNLCSSLMNEKTINTAGMFDLSDLIALVSRADLLIANSTGPIHIASALGKHVIGFYPKIEECAPRRWGPFTNKAVIFTPEIDCDNCTRKQCENLDCMSSIDTGKIIRTVESIAVEIRERRTK